MASRTRNTSKQRESQTNNPFVNPTEDQSSLIGEFRSAFNNEENAKMKDSDCIRFLIAREWDTEKAIAMKQYNFKLRKHLQCDLLFSKPKDPIIDIITKLRRQGINYGCYGEDKQGHPVCYQFQGAFISLPMYKYISTDQYLNWMQYNFELFLQNYLIPSGKSQVLVVIDLTDLAMCSRHNGHFTNAAIAYNEAHAPEYGTKVICVNAPRLIYVLWGMMKHLLPERTIKKISFHDKESTASVLAEYIDKKYLPKMYGGDVDEHKFFTPKLDEEDIKKMIKKLKRLRNKNAKRDNAKTMNLSPGETETVNIECKAPSLVKWWFVVEAYNVLFTVRWRPCDQKEWIEIREPKIVGDEEYKGKRFPVHSDYMVDCAGTMELEFSNKHSMFRSKTIRYDIHVSNLL